MPRSWTMRIGLLFRGKGVHGLQQEDVIRAYIEVGRLGPAAHRLDDYIRDRPLVAWEMLREIFRRAAASGLQYSDMTWGIETLLAKHGPVVVEAVAEFAGQNEFLRKCLVDIDAWSDRKPEKYRVPADIRARALVFGSGPSRTGQSDTASKPLEKPLEEIVEAWIGHTKVFWSFDYLYELVRDKPREALELVRQLIDAAPVEVLSFVAAGPLEDLLKNHCSEVMDRVEEIAAADEEFHGALRGVWLKEGDEAYPRWKAVVDRYETRMSRPE